MSEVPLAGKIALLADDLTGALDCAAVFVHSGFNPYVSLHGEVSTSSELPQVISVNADTRRLNMADASAAISTAARSLEKTEARLRYVKIDSTLRGHPGLEIDKSAVLTGSQMVIVAPSFPATGRVVRNGQLLVHGVPLAETEVGRDPLSPTDTSCVADILKRHTELPIKQLSLEDVRSGELSDVLGSFIDRSNEYPTLIVCDAETDSDLDTLVLAANELERRAGTNDHVAVILAGSAGLAAALARSLQPQGRAKSVAQDPLARSPLLIVTASQRSLADRQLAALVENELAGLHTLVFELDSRGDLVCADFDSSTATRALAAGNNVAVRAVVSTDLSQLSVAEVRSAADSLLEQLGQIIASIGSQSDLGGIIIIGGDTAAAILNATGTEGIVLTSESHPGVAVGAVSGGELNGVTIATKAGAFGDDTTLVKLHNYLTDTSDRNGEQS